MNIPEKFQIHTHPVADARAVIKTSKARFTVLTERLLRMEYSPEEKFEDRPSQAFWHRAFPAPDFQVIRIENQEEGDRLEIMTTYLHLRYVPGEPFTKESLSISVRGTETTWRPGDPNLGNLSGTYRTLDLAAGPVALGPGLVSRIGWSLVDDSNSLVFNEDGWLEIRQAPQGTQDLYFYGYGHDYPAALVDFTKIAGSTPLIPRWALGNWWSRYWAYTQEELTSLMQEFQEQETPLSVCIIDMDWHLTNTGNQCSGWTGYTWNRELFPDPKGFINWLHEQGLKTALNLHPAEGVHPHEEMYEQMAKRIGIDPQSETPVPFDLADPAFAAAYFEVLHHPHEDIGVDFWWLDWQQGTLTGLPGLDPLWWLNHLHAMDRARGGKHRPFIFSRWGGLGNHRYPIGFSGDTHVTWEALAFQPSFTATAANVFYNWWSHDIGGHMFGTEEPELYLRWVQYGVFSPILRLHSTKVPLHERLPWKYDAETSRLARQAMQLRHALIPYLYTAAWREHTQSLPPIRPMYHAYPEQEEAYACSNQYEFGSELLVAPFTFPVDRETKLARQMVWLPQGDWFDFFTGERYQGGGWMAFYGSLADTPVFARSGGIIPLDSHPRFGEVGNPVSFQVHIFPGMDHRFDLYEDDGESNAYQQGEFVQTALVLHWSPQTIHFEIGPAEGKKHLLPDKRSWSLIFHCLENPGEIQVEVNQQSYPAESVYLPETRTLTIEIKDTPVEAHIGIQVSSSGEHNLAGPSVSKSERLRKLLTSFRLDTMTKLLLLGQADEIVDHPTILANYRARLKPVQLRALLETITDAGFDRLASTGKETILLWNNGSSKASFQLSIEHKNEWDTRKRFAFEAGTLPAHRMFAVEDLEGKDWSIRVSYQDLLTYELNTEREETLIT